MNVQRFIKGTRYYELRLKRDLFGWVVLKCYGRINTRLGQIRTVPFETEQAALAYIEQACAQRLKRGYSLSSPSKPTSTLLSSGKKEAH
ncbi:WGR domain-containing protein [Vibrio navarrensis]